MIKGTTKSGFEFELELDSEILDDYEFLEALRGVDEGDFSELPKIVDVLLGEEQKEALKNHLRKENGKVKLSDMCEEVAEIFSASEELKNS